MCFPTASIEQRGNARSIRWLDREQSQAIDTDGGRERASERDSRRVGNTQTIAAAAEHKELKLLTLLQ